MKMSKRLRLVPWETLQVRGRGAQRHRYMDTAGGGQSCVIKHFSFLSPLSLNVTPSPELSLFLTPYVCLGHFSAACFSSSTICLVDISIL